MSLTDSDHIIGGRREDVQRVQKQEASHLSFDTAKDFLRNTKVSTLFPKDRPKILTVNSQTSVSEALELLVSHKILSLPVFDDKQQNFSCFIDMLDIVNHIMESLKEAEITGGGFAEMLKTSEKLTKITVEDVGGASGRNPYYPIDENAPLLTAVRLMADNKVHRIPVVGSDPMRKADLITIITQSQVADIALKNIKKFTFSSSTVGDFKLGIKEVCTIDKSEKAIEAFKLIHHKRISGVGIVDNGVLIGNISASDIRHIGPTASLISRLFLPVEEYLKFIPENKEALVPGPYCVLPAATFEEVLTKMVMLRIHRMYVINQERVPIGVISLSDVLAAIIENIN